MRLSALIAGLIGLALTVSPAAAQSDADSRTALIRGLQASVFRVLAIQIDPAPDHREPGCRPAYATSTGTGFVVEKWRERIPNNFEEHTAHVVTNHHVAFGCQAPGRRYRILVQVYEGGVYRTYGAVRLGGLPEFDIAVLRVRGPLYFPTDLAWINMRALAWATDVRVGDDVLALGFPSSDALSGSLTVTRGIVSAVNRTWVTRDDRRVDYFPGLVQTDAAINPGNSGGPLVDRQGHVVGINTFRLLDRRSVVLPGLNLAVSSPIAVPVVRQIIATARGRADSGTVKRADFGLRFFPLDPETLVRLSLLAERAPWYGNVALVIESAGGGASSAPFDAARLNRCDALLRIGERHIETPGDLDYARILYGGANKVQVTAAQLAAPMCRAIAGATPPEGIPAGDAPYGPRTIEWPLR